MKMYFLFIALFFNAVAMQPADSEKQETVKKMLACVQSDFESKFDQVMQLDLTGLSARLPVICAPSTGGIFYNGDKGDFVKERTLLRELAVTKEYTPLIPVLFKRWQRLEKHWIANSMLLHAVEAHMVGTTQELLKLGINPNQQALYFFQNNSVKKIPFEIAFERESSENSRRLNIELIRVLLKNDLQIASESAHKVLFAAIERYFHGANDYRFVIETFLERGIDPLAQAPQEKCVYSNDQVYHASSAYDLVSQLAKVDPLSEERCQQNGQLRRLNEEHRKKFQELLKLFNTYKKGKVS